MKTNDYVYQYGVPLLTGVGALSIAVEFGISNVSWIGVFAFALTYIMMHPGREKLTQELKKCVN